MKILVVGVLIPVHWTSQDSIFCLLVDGVLVHWMLELFSW
jgi:hypothetical protein